MIRGDLFRSLISFDILTEMIMHASRFVFLTSLVVAAVVTRIIPHPPNVTAVGALAVFAGAMFRDRRVAFALPLVAMFFSDLVLGLHLLMPIVYGSFALSVSITRWLASSRKIVGFSASVLLGGVQFFVVTNAACWVVYYPITWEGFVSCYANALPYLRNSLLGDAGYTVALFGAIWLAEKLAPTIREQVPSAEFARI